MEGLQCASSTAVASKHALQEKEIQAKAWIDLADWNMEAPKAGNTMDCYRDRGEGKQLG